MPTQRRASASGHGVCAGLRHLQKCEHVLRARFDFRFLFRVSIVDFTAKRQSLTFGPTGNAQGVELARARSVRVCAKLTDVEGLRGFKQIDVCHFSVKT